MNGKAAKKEVAMKKDGLLVKSLLTAAFAILLGGVLMLSPAQAEPRGEPQREISPEVAVCVLKDRLDLTDEQADAIKPIIEESMSKRREIFEKYSDQRRETRKDMRSEMQELRGGTEGDLAAVLTEEQIEDFQALMEERKERRKERFKERRSRRGQRGGKF